MTKTKKSASEKHEMFRANPVPIESRIPLFDKVMCDQERRSVIPVFIISMLSFNAICSLIFPKFYV